MSRLFSSEPADGPFGDAQAGGANPADRFTWWGDYRIPLGKTGRWLVGPLTLWISNFPGEWRIAKEDDETLHGRPSAFELLEKPDGLPGIEKTRRVALARDREDITLTALLADRPVVAQPDGNIFLPPEEGVTIYVSSRIWIQIATEKRAIVLDDFPISRPSDTWFGPSTLEGELCYASRVYFGLNLEDIWDHRFRAITAVRIENKAETILPLKRLKLPAPYLALYCGPDGRLWTQDLTFEWTRGDDFVAVKLREQPPKAAPEATLLSPARQKALDLNVFRAFSAIF